MSRLMVPDPKVEKASRVLVPLLVRIVVDWKAVCQGAGRR